MKPQRTAYLVAGAFLAFAAWEAAQHVWLMDLPMAAYHTVSLTVDLALVLLIALAALAAVRRHTQRDARHHALQDAVVTTLAQDLRPPLLSLLTQLRILQSTPTEGTGEQTGELLRQAEATGGVLLEMIEELVAMAGEVDERPPACASVSLNEIADQSLAAFKAAAEDRQVTLKAHVGTDLPQTCTTPHAVLRAMSTLVDHALRATPRGGQVELRLAWDDQRRAVALSVSDTGRQLLDHPADLEEVLARHPLVGLRYCQALVRALDGSIRYEPKPGGNTFSISLPVPGAGG